jgi:putative ABC transport system permease protein
MIKHYLKFFATNILRQKGFTFINIAGLAIGMAISILILLYVFHELSYDRFISNHRNKYCINITIEYTGGKFEADRSCGELVNIALEKYPEVVNAVSLYDEGPVVKYGEKTFVENRGDVFFTFHTVFDFFDLEIVKGNPDKVFNEPFSVVLSESKAKKYFKEKNPIGEILLFNDKFQMKVTGVFKDFPENSHVQFGLLAPIEAFMEINGINNLSEYGNSAVTYFETIKNFNEDELSRKLSEATLSFMPEEYKKQMNINVSHYLMPIRKIHLFTNFDAFDRGKTVSRVVYLYLYSAVAMFILLLACVNFMNLSTARYTGRAREVGLRKILGANKGILIKQFLGESIFISFISLATAIVFAELFLPVFNSLIDSDLAFIYSGNIKFIVGIIGLGLMVGLISGMYPAFFLTSFKPISILRGKLRGGKSSKIFRWSLVVFQFFIALVLTSCTLVIFTQLNYVKNRDLGFDRDNLLVVMLRGQEVRSNPSVIRDEFQKIPGIMDCTFSSDKPGVGTSWYGSYKYEDREDDEHPPFATVFIDENYINTVGLQIVEGKNFSEFKGLDSANILINEAMVKYLGWENPLGKHIYEFTREHDYKLYTVIGVVKNYNMESLHKEISPLMFTKSNRARYCLVRVHPNNTEKTIDEMREAWKNIYPDKPFSFHFLNESYDMEYRSERKLANIFVYFTAFAIFIACLGIFGLVSFITASRTKEIGIRKVLGSGAGEVVVLISKDFIKMIGIAFLIASPVAWYIMNLWLSNFAYKINLSAWIFILSGLITLIVVVLSTGYQALKSAFKNPIDAIRYE